ncbi:hypothetical protein LY76DRAFT_414108 [Colletotrichum caudatum]|nr:hypothetical protein LY76DRAFT_414108 [Colletotrichum caudatum]
MMQPRQLIEGSHREKADIRRRLLPLSLSLLKALRTGHRMTLPRSDREWGGPPAPTSGGFRPTPEKTSGARASTLQSFSLTQQQQQQQQQQLDPISSSPTHFRPITE